MPIAPQHEKTDIKMEPVPQRVAPYSAKNSLRKRQNPKFLFKDLSIGRQAHKQRPQSSKPAAIANKESVFDRERHFVLSEYDRTSSKVRDSSMKAAR